jgi:PAS domain S-box-containing protein
MLAVITIPVVGVREAFQAERAYSIHVVHLLILLVLILPMAIAALLIELFVSQKLSFDAAISGDRLRMAMASTKFIGWDWDIKNERTVWFGDGSSLFESLSASADDFPRFLHEEDRNRVVEALAGARLHRSAYRDEFRVISEDGRTHWVNATGTFYYGRSGEAERMLGVLVDITEQKQAQQALIKSEEKFSKAFRESPVALKLTRGQDNRCLDVNETFERITGWNRDEVIGHTVSDIRLWVDPAQRKHYEKQVLAGLVTKNWELRYRCKNGEERVGLGSGELIEIDGEICILSAIQDITDRQRAEELLQHKASELAEAERLAQLGSWRWDQKTRTLAWSEELARIHGLDPKCPAPSQEELSDLFTPGAWERLRTTTAQALKSGSVENVDLEIIRPDGARRWITVRVHAGRGSSGELIFYAGTAQDITERRNSEQALRESEERFRRVVEHIGDALAVDDVAGTVIFANDRFLDLFGFDRGDAGKITLQDYIAPEYFGQVQDRHHRRMEGEEVASHFEYEGIRRNGTRLWLDSEVVSIRSQEGKLIGSQKLLRDITERKRAENALRESEQRFRLLANQAPVLIWMSGIDKLCSYFNRPWLEFTGKSLEEEIGVGWADGVHSEDYDDCLKAYSEAFDRREVFRLQYRLKRHDGEYRWILDIGTPRFNSDGSFVGYIGSCIDVTEQKIAEAALASMGRRLMEAHEEERTWIGRELHDDINQRLALLAVELDRWNQQLPPSPKFSVHLRHAQQRIQEIAQDVQGLSHRLHSSKLEYLGLTAASNSFCKEIAAKTKTEVHFRHKNIPRMIPKEISLCFFRVLQESLQNASKYSGVRVYEVELSGEYDCIELKVTDRGIGFDQREAMKGRGLGLISMRERLHLVNGEFTVISEVGHGTTIRARVPLKADEYQAMAG